MDVETSSKNMIDGLWHVGIEIILGWSAAKSHHLTTTTGFVVNQVHAGDRQGMRRGQHRGNNAPWALKPNLVQWGVLGRNLM